MSSDGTLVQKPVRVRTTEPNRLLALLEPYQPLEVVVEASPARPWLYELLRDAGHAFVLAHPKKLRVIAEANYENDQIDVILLARMRLVDLIPPGPCQATLPEACGLLTPSAS